MGKRAKNGGGGGSRTRARSSWSIQKGSPLKRMGEIVFVLYNTHSSEPVIKFFCYYICENLLAKDLKPLNLVHIEKCNLLLLVVT